MSITAVRGFKDILPAESGKWQRMEDVARKVFRCYGFSEIRTPVLERTELFSRAIGESTDIVEKEMYTFADRNGDSLTLRPEATASVLRAFVEHALHAQDKAQRLYTIGPMFRYERPQKGRHRQFHQINAEAIGQDTPTGDAELMAMAMHILAILDVRDISLQINSLGCIQCRPQYRLELVSFLGKRLEALCPDCQRRSTSNPLRVLDCKAEGCRAALAGMPSLPDHLCEACTKHFAQLQRSLALFGIPFDVNPLMVRGLDYYTRTTFEITSSALGAQSAVAAGGRYDGLIKELGGPELPGIGFAIGMERLSLLMGTDRAAIEPSLFIVALGEKAHDLAVQVLHRARLNGTHAEMTFEPASLKSQMRRANKVNARVVLIIGDEELAADKVTMRDMRSGRQWTVSVQKELDTLIRDIDEEMRRLIE